MKKLHQYLMNFILFLSVIGLCSGQGKLKNIHFGLDNAGNQHLEIKSGIVNPDRDFRAPGVSYEDKQFPAEKLLMALDRPQVLDRDSDGRPLAISYPQQTAGIDLRSSLEAGIDDFLTRISSLLKMENAKERFKIKSVAWDALGMVHVKMQQLWKGIPVFGGEIILHGNTQGFNFSNGFYYTDTGDDSPASPGISGQKAVEQILKSSREGIITRASLEKMKQQNGIIAALTDAPQVELMYFENEGTLQLVWHIVYYTSVMDKWEAFVNAHTAEILKKRYLSCSFDGKNYHPFKNASGEVLTAPPSAGDRTATGRDLNGKTQTIHVWNQNGTNYLIDASRPMFNAGASQMPNNPVGALITLDASNTNPQNNDFKVGLPTSSSNQWSPLQISAHYNGAVAYEYYRQTYNRNSIDGQGGNIISIFNIVDKNGGGFDNAFWNGKAMFYGNGRNLYTKLAGGLDVAAHEMTHGVTQATANLVYQDEPGAINESMSDVFGVMVDREDWQLGEDVVKRSAFPSGALRDMSDPHNGANRLDQPGYQPKHVNEQYHGQGDNGGVHVNSGITNYAFYLFVQSIKDKVGSEEEAKKRAEQIYYRTLTKYLTRSSKFVDLRVAVMRAAKDLYGSTYETLARNAFAAVGIGSGGGGGGGSNSKDLLTNPGVPYLIANDDKYQSIYLFNLNTQANGVALYSKGVKSKVSMMDNGSFGVFVGKDGVIYGLIKGNGDNYSIEVVNDHSPWRNAVISKDGNTIAALADVAEPKIYFWSFAKKEASSLELYNPTTADGIKTGDVQYADAMEFDLSGQYLIYDALSTLKNSAGQDYQYWDIGIVNVWNNASNNWGSGKIQKLVSNLPEGLSIGNPTLAKNSPYIMAFDIIDSRSGSDQYAVLGLNIEQNKIGQIYQNNQVGVPNYSVDDKFVVFNASDQSNNPVLGVIEMAQDKINSSGQANILLNGGRFGVFFADGKRNLNIKTKDITGNSRKHFALIKNPVTDVLRLKNLVDVTIPDIRISIVNSSGKIIKSLKRERVLPGAEFVVPVSKLPAEIYLIRIQGKDFVEGYEMVKQ